jgi:hypothetical protein
MYDKARARTRARARARVGKIVSFVERGRPRTPADAGAPSRTALARFPVPSAVDAPLDAAKCCTCSLHSHWLLTYPALQKGGAWVLSKSAMERGRFTPRACRVDYRLRPCVPGCVTLRVQRPTGATRGPDPRLKRRRAGLLTPGALQVRRTVPAPGAPVTAPAPRRGGVHEALKAAVTATTTRDREKVPRDDEQAVAGL